MNKKKEGIIMLIAAILALAAAAFDPMISLIIAVGVLATMGLVNITKSVLATMGLVNITKK